MGVAKGFDIDANVGVGTQMLTILISSLPYKTSVVYSRPQRRRGRLYSGVKTSAPTSLHPVLSTNAMLRYVRFKPRVRNYAVERWR